MVRIAHITTVPLSLFFFRGQTEYMKSQGFDFQVISSPGELLDQFSERERVAVYPVNMARQITPVKDLGALRRLVATLRRIRPSIVHAHTPKGGLLGMIAAWVARVPVRIYHIRGLPYMTAAGGRRTLLIWSERLSCRLAHEVLCVSHSIRDVAVADRVCPPEKIKVLLGGSGNGVDASGRFNPARFSDSARQRLRAKFDIGVDELVIGYVGRIVRDKGVEELAAAWASIQTKHPDAHLILVGPIEPQDPVSAATLDSLRNHPRVHFVDHVDDPGPCYAMFDIVALPTYREGFPNVPLEASAMGIPVVATSIPGCVDAVEDGVTGTLVPPRDAVALQEAIERYLDDSELRTAHGKAGRERVLREFRQEDIWEAICLEYVRLLNERRLPVPQPVT